MSVDLIRIDRAGFGAAWLASVKEHCRVEFDRDDVYLQGAVIRAADQVERTTGQKIMPAEWVYRVDSEYWRDGDWIRAWPAERCLCCGDFDGAGGYMLPPNLRPLAGFRAMIQDPETPAAFEDRSPSWRLVGAVGSAMGPLFLAPSGAVYSDDWQIEAAAPWVFYLTVGAVLPDDADPGLADLVLRTTAHLYENRELMVGAGQVSPDVMPFAFGSLWVPRC